MKRLHNSLHKAGHASKGRAEVVALMSGDGEVIDLRSDSDEEVEVVAAPAVPVAAAARRAEKRTLAEPVALGGNKRAAPNQHGRLVNCTSNRARSRSRLRRSRAFRCTIAQ